MARGDHIRVKRRGFWHHGIDCGDGTVIHYTGEPKNLTNAAVARTPMAQFAKGGVVRTVKSACAHDPEEILRRASSRIGETRYGVVRNNCEHFAHWCRTGLPSSKQVRRALAGAGTVAVAGVAVLVIGARALVRRA
ncbi:MAG: lecithin retinol acyltransferase family protein [Candidatus Hydrogenedentes bacterium]|nr:lecithin retinol acyltransferase family protein [Candidatus Hydrogenedentota bacterium]